MLSKFFATDESEESTSDESEPEILALFEQIFFDPTCRKEITKIDKNARTLAQLSSNLAVAIEFKSPTDYALTKINKYLDKRIIQAGYSGALLVKLVYSCKQFVHAQLIEYFNRDEDLTEQSDQSTLKKYFPLIAPQLKIFHNDINELGTFRIEINGIPQAFFKVGRLRQCNDHFLHELYRHLKDIMGFTYESEGVFPHVWPFQISLSDVVNNALPGRTEHAMCYVEREQDRYLQHIIDTRTPCEGNPTVILGGIQSALPQWEHDSMDSDQLLVMMSLVMMLGGRDVSESGIRGNGCIIDFEEFLELKNGMPAIHLPFVDLIIDRVFNQDHWIMLNRCLAKIDHKQFKSFLHKHEFAPAPNLPAYWNACAITRNVEHRSDFTVKKPTFIDHRLLSTQQIELCLGNLQALKAAVKECLRANEANLFTLLSHFCPAWAEQCVSLMSFRLAAQEQKQAEHYDEDTIHAFHDSLRSSPIQMAGNIRRTPSPTQGQEELYTAVLSSSGTLLSNTPLRMLSRSLGSTQVTPPANALRK